MRARRFDVVVVGARCAGAALATHLGRAGLAVAVLDAARLPSDQPASTHLIQPPGMDELDVLGVAAAVRLQSPALGGGRFEFDGREMLLGYGRGRAGHCLRREKLDALLQDAAVAAGADLRAESRVVGVLRDGSGRVSGVEVQRRGRTLERLEADLVVGADGRHSTIARLVGAREYLGYDGPRGTYWAYWRRPPSCNAHLFYNAFVGDHARVVFPTDDDLVLIASAPPLVRARAWHDNRRAAYVADIRSFPPLESLLGDDEPVSQVRGMLNPRYFFRVSAGPGWALVGDAGHHKDFVIGLGISDALRDARSLAHEIGRGSHGALEAYWRRRDAERIEMFRWSQDLGRADAVNAIERLVAERAAATPHDRLGAVVDSRLSPYELFPPSQVARWVAGAVLRGRLDVLAPFIATGFRALAVRREAARYNRLLATVSSFDTSPTTSSAPARRRPSEARRSPSRQYAASS